MWILPNDADKFIQRNKETAIAKYGDRLDESRNVIGTNYYFDHMWRFRTR